MRASWAIILMLMVVLATGSCGEKPQSSPTVDEAARQATQAAAALVTVDHGDTLALQRAILHAKSISSAYQMRGDTAAVNAFDRNFADYLKAHDNELYSAIF